MSKENQPEHVYHDDLEEALEHFDKTERCKFLIGKAIDDLGLEAVLNIVAEHIGGSAVMRFE